jgi:hypothetical protein
MADMTDQTPLLQRVEEVARIIDPKAYELYTRPDGEVVFWTGPAPRRRALAKAEAVLLLLGGGGSVSQSQPGSDGERAAAGELSAPVDVVTVPREPTRLMWAAAGDAVVALQHRGVGHHDKIIEAVWQAMLSEAVKS